MFQCLNRREQGSNLTEREYQAVCYGFNASIGVSRVRTFVLFMYLVDQGLFQCLNRREQGSNGRVYEGAAAPEVFQCLNRREQGSNGSTTTPGGVRGVTFQCLNRREQGSNHRAEIESAQNVCVSMPQSA